MPIIFFANKDEAVKVVSSIHYQPDLLDAQTKSSGVEVDSVPKPEEKPGKDAILKYENGQLFYEYVDRPMTQDEKMVELQQKYDLMQSALDELIFGGML